MQMKRKSWKLETTIHKVEFPRNCCSQASTPSPLHLKLRPEGPSLKPDTGYGGQSSQHGRDVASKKTLFCQDCHYDTKMHPFAEAKIQSRCFQFLHWFRQQMRKRQNGIRDHLSHGFGARGWLSGKNKNSLDVTGSYISKRKLPTRSRLVPSAFAVMSSPSTELNGCLRTTSLPWFAAEAECYHCFASSLIVLVAFRRAVFFFFLFSSPGC